MNRSMSDDWDLYAVVRSCTNAAATSTASPTITDAVVAPVKESGEPFLNVPSIHSGDAPSDFPGFINHEGDPFQGLEIYKELLYENTQPQQTPTASNSVLQEFQNQWPPQQHVYPQPHRAIQPQQHLHLSHGMFGSSLSFPSTSPQPIGTRRRKNQHAKMIHQMTQEELSADTWAWRKYGQKPIKGSPYPRNYYRCSTSKGCTARKQVERCPTDPNMYVVSYSGEHSHPRPTHRSSLAGSSRSKISAAAKPTSNSTEPINIVTTPTSRASSIVSCSSASPASTFSLITPISAAEESAEGDGHMENNNTEILLGEQEEDQEEGWTPYDDDDDGPDGDDILIPNSLVTDDLLKGLQFKN